MYKYVLNSVVKISLMFAKYFEYYTIAWGGAFFRGHAVEEVCTVIRGRPIVSPLGSAKILWKTRSQL